MESQLCYWTDLKKLVLDYLALIGIQMFEQARLIKQKKVKEIREVFKMKIPQ